MVFGVVLKIPRNQAQKVEFVANSNRSSVLLCPISYDANFMPKERHHKVT